MGASVADASVELYVLLAEVLADAVGFMDTEVLVETSIAKEALEKTDGDPVAKGWLADKVGAIVLIARALYSVLTASATVTLWFGLETLLDRTLT